MMASVAASGLTGFFPRPRRTESQTSIHPRDSFQMAPQRRRRLAVLPEKQMVLEIALEGEAAPPWLSPTVEQIVPLLDLKPGRNSYAAAPVTNTAARVALDVLAATMEELTPEPFVVPLSTGGLQLEWHRDGIDLEVEIGPDGRVGGSYEDSLTGERWDRELQGNFDLLNSALTELARRRRP